MLGKLTKIALLGGLVLLATTVLAASAFAQTTAYGLVNFTAMYSLTSIVNGNGDLGLDYTPPKKDLEGGGGTFLFHVVQAKIGIKSSSDSDMGKVNLVVEGDFDGKVPAGSGLQSGESSAPLFRLRHAYASVGNLLIGRTWTGISTDLSWVGSTLDPNIAYGTSALLIDPRTEQVRYTVPMDNNKFVISVEQISGVKGSGTVYEISTMPPRIVPAFYMDLGMAKVQIVAAMSTWRLNEGGRTAASATGTAAAAAADLDGNGKKNDDLTTSGTAFGVNAAIKAGDAGTVKVHFLTGAAGTQCNCAAIGTPAFYAEVSGSKISLKAASGTDMSLSYAHKLGAATINATYGSTANADYKKQGGSIDTGTSIHLNYI